MEYTEIQALQVSADNARRAKLAELAELNALAIATAALMNDIAGIVSGKDAVGGHAIPVIAARRDKLEPLANSLGFSLQPSPTYVGQFILVPWSNA